MEAALRLLSLKAFAPSLARGVYSRVCAQWSEIRSCQRVPSPETDTPSPRLPLSLSLSVSSSVRRSLSLSLSSPSPLPPLLLSPFLPGVLLLVSPAEVLSGWVGYSVCVSVCVCVCACVCVLERETLVVHVTHMLRNRAPLHLCFTEAQRNTHA